MGRQRDLYIGNLPRRSDIAGEVLVITRVKIAGDITNKITQVKNYNAHAKHEVSNIASTTNGFDQHGGKWVSYNGLI